MCVAVVRDGEKIFDGPAAPAPAAGWLSSSGSVGISGHVEDGEKESEAGEVDGWRA